MRIWRVVVVAAACCVGGTAAMHGQVGGDEPGGQPQAAAPAPAAQPRLIKVSAGVMQGQIRTKVNPVYPPDARQAGTEGAVVLHAIIGADGLIEEVEAISGPAALKGAAVEAVSHWTYKPYLLNGRPVRVDTFVLVNFSLHHAPN